MTKLEIEIVKNKEKKAEEKLEGTYMATFNNEDDRIVVVNNLNKKVADAVINKSYTGELIVQRNQSMSNYHSFKKIKALKIEVELE